MLEISHRILSTFRKRKIGDNYGISCYQSNFITIMSEYQKKKSVFDVATVTLQILIDNLETRNNLMINFF